ncbi:MAG: hypothetical protein KBG92_05525 [Spirochaetes bacterium]|nr:hypothetical protein [Spirochaetota bacterium]
MLNNTSTNMIFKHEFFETTSVTDFLLKIKENPPEGYPDKTIPDTYTDKPFLPTFKERKDYFLNYCLKNPAKFTIKGYYYELVRLYKNKGPIYISAIKSALDYINERYDCSDFVMLGIIRLLYQFKDNQLLDSIIIEYAENTLLQFKYWPDEPGIDSMCTWTENHQIMFLSNEYLAGQLFPDTIFSNSGMTGMQKMEHARKRILQWLELRFKTGFSEWLSHIYYDEDITALVNLVDFCNDLIISKKAEIVLNCLLYDIALNSFKGCFSSTHGRSYANEKRSALCESTIDTAKLLFGMGIFSNADNMSAVTLAISTKYRMPKVLYNVACDTPEEIINKQRMGLKLNELKKWGLSINNPDDVMVLLSLEAYTHPKTINATMKLFDTFNWWENNFFSMFKSKRNFLSIARRIKMLPVVAKIFEKDITRNTREEVNIYTYKTPDYMLSCAQDYRKGYGGDQQHIWQATLGPEAVCFTTHPGSYENTSTGYWVGSGTLPRVAQIKNLVIAIYKISTMPGLYKTNKLFFTHAWFPANKFDTIHEQNGWAFAQKGNAYIALYSQYPYRWNTASSEKNELITDGKENIWICQMGSQANDGNFNSFINSILNTQLYFRKLHVNIISPSLGNISFGWTDPLKHNCKSIDLSNYKRYENPYSSADFPPDKIAITCNDSWLKLDFERGICKADTFV